MKRILVFGNGGSGKSTLSVTLGDLLHLPVIHLDKYFWQPNWIATPVDDWNIIVESFSDSEEWIIDGNYSRTMNIRIKRADLIIFLDMPNMLCLYRIFKRRIKYNRKTRPDMNEECTEKLDLEFIKWVWNFKKRNRAKILDKLEVASKTKRIIILKNRKQVNEFIEGLKNYKIK
ncbi:MAG TPA: DNA topology modulation protein [Ignavibacteria bacterium]|nr:AAA family ATPase [Bacteroidota bacterium]HRI86230.1 DNA topology modulation protein [Ignavibacteria bacterium]HRJ98283.1 DNA topology modulation protein [Ignavibacteria bacterium]